MPEKPVSAALRVRVQPGAKRSEVVGWVAGALRVRIAAPPIEGRANEALVAFIAETLGVPKSRVAIRAGHGGRDKLLVVEGLTREALTARLPSAE